MTARTIVGPSPDAGGRVGWMPRGRPIRLTDFRYRRPVVIPNVRVGHELCRLIAQET